MGDYIIPSVAEIKAAASLNKPKFEAVSLFAGGGGSSTGYRMAGGKVLAINEFIPEAINTYRANWPDTIILPGDVRKLTAEHILAEIGKAKGELDLLDGSPPCSAFSTAGAREKGWGKTKKYSDNKILNTNKFRLISKEWLITKLALAGIKKGNFNKLKDLEIQGVGTASYFK